MKYPRSVPDAYDDIYEQRINGQPNDPDRIAISATCVAIVLVNSCIIIMALTSKTIRRQNCTIFFVNLMLAHLLLGALQLVLFATSGVGLCIATNALVITIMTNLCVLSVDRMVAIKYPLLYIRAEKSVFVFVFCCSWLVPVCIFLVRWNFRSNRGLSEQILCITIIVAYLSAVVILGTMNWLVFREARVQIVKIRRNQVTSLRQLESVSANQVAPMPSHDRDATSSTERESSTEGSPVRAVYSQLPRLSRGEGGRSSDVTRYEDSSAHDHTSAQWISHWRKVIRRQKREIRAAYICSGCVLCFAVLWSAYIASIFFNLLHEKNTARTLSVVGKQIAYLSSIVDPFLYSYLNKSLQSALRRVFCKRRTNKVSQLPQRRSIATSHLETSTVNDISP